jgi:hypothetical protein
MVNGMSSTWSKPLVKTTRRLHDTMQQQGAVLCFMTHHSSLVSLRRRFTLQLMSVEGAARPNLRFLCVFDAIRRWLIRLIISTNYINLKFVLALSIQVLVPTSQQSLYQKPTLRYKMGQAISTTQFFVYGRRHFTS